MFNRSNTKDVFDQLLEQDDQAVESTATDRPNLDGGNVPDIADDAEVGQALAPEDEDPDEAEVAEALDPGGDEATETPTRRSHRWLRRVPAAAGIVVFVAALGLAAFFGWQLKQVNDAAEAGRTALDVARSYAVTLTSVDYQKIDENTTQVLDGATGEFKDMYSQSATQLRQLLIDNKAVSHGAVVDSAIKSATNTKVEVLIFVDQSISNAVNPEPRIDRSRVGITMDLIDGRWLASKVDIK